VDQCFQVRQLHPVFECELAVAGLLTKGISPGAFLENPANSARDFGQNRVDPGAEPKETQIYSDRFDPYFCGKYAVCCGL